MEYVLVGIDIDHEIGRGASGRVYLGSDKIREEMAIKALERQLWEDDDGWGGRCDALVQEGQFLAALQHPNIVRVFQVVESQNDDAIFLLMEYCAGGSLEARLQAGPMIHKEARSAIRHAAFGMGYLHSEGCLHRDIKPGNILLSTDGVCKLGDFGHVTDQVIAGVGPAGGYFNHLAYEYYSNLATTISTDIWALGFTFYRLLHGSGFCERHWQEYGRPRETVPLGGFRDSLDWLPHVPKAWRTFVRRTLHDDPNERIGSAEEFLRELSKLPVALPWRCTVAPDLIQWRMEDRKRSRVFQVRWEASSSRSAQWVATSAPMGVGRTVTRGRGSGGPKSTLKQIQRWFADFK